MSEESNLTQALRHEDRLRRVEDRMSTHEAVCEARYQNIIASGTQTQTAVNDLHTMLKDQVRYMLWALIAMALVSAFGRDVISALLTKYLGL